MANVCVIAANEKPMMDPILFAEQALWKDNLSQTRAGRLLAQHHNQLLHRSNGDAFGTAFHQVVTNRTAFISLLAESVRNGLPLPVGLPRPLPKYMLMANMCGEHVLMYSDFPYLIQIACVYGPHSCADQQRVDFNCFSGWLEEQDSRLCKGEQRNSSVFVSYSLPWGCDICTACWEIITVRIVPEVAQTVIDREIFKTSFNPSRERGHPTLDARGKPHVMLDIPGGPALRFAEMREKRELSNSFHATCVDVSGDDVTTANSSHNGPDAKKIQQQAEILSQMQKDRKADQKLIRDKNADISRLKEEHAAALTAAKKEKELEYVEQLKNMSKENVDARMLILSLQSDNENLTKQLTTQSAAISKYTKRDTESVQEIKLVRIRANKQAEVHNKAAAQLRFEKEQLQSKIEDLKKRHSEEIGDMERKHKENAERDKEAVKVLDERLRSEKQVLKQLAEINDLKEAQATSLADECERLRKLLAEEVAAGKVLLQNASDDQKELKKLKESYKKKVETQDRGTHTHIAFSSVECQTEDDAKETTQDASTGPSMSSPTTAPSPVPLQPEYNTPEAAICKLRETVEGVADWMRYLDMHTRSVQGPYSYAPHVPVHVVAHRFPPHMPRK